MGILKHVKWGKVLDVTLTIASIAVPLIHNQRQEAKAEAKAKAEMVKAIREEVRQQTRRSHHG